MKFSRSALQLLFSCAVVGFGASALAHSATTNAPAGQYPAQGHGQGRGAYTIRTFAPSGTQTSFIPAAVATAGGNLPHNNMQVSLVMTWCIALQGIFPARN